MESVVNWSRIIWLALSLSLAQFLIGVIEGILAGPHTASWLLAGHSVSLAVAVTLFASFAIRTTYRPFAHAWLGMLLQILLAGLLSSAIAPWFGSVPWHSVVMEWVVLVFALVVGTLIGIGLRNRSSRADDA